MMPYLYVYSPSDFVEIPAAEQGAMAQGIGPFTMELALGAKGTMIFIEDDDAVFDEVDGGQKVGKAVDFDGWSLAAGTSVHSAYDLINSDTGHQVTSLHFGGNGYQQGAVDGIISTEPMEPGKSYIFDIERTSHRKANDYDKFVSCFVSGTEILTPVGPRRIEHVSVGDLVETADHGAQPVRWVGARTVPGVGAFAPVCLSTGFLGLSRPLYVSPQHRMLVGGGPMEVLFGLGSAFVAAKHLCDGVRAWRAPRDVVTYHHIMFDQHEVIWANRAMTESFLPDMQGLKGLSPAARRELFHLFPELLVKAFGTRQNSVLARPSLKSFEAAVLRA